MAELNCAEALSHQEGYDLAWHVGALFLVLAFSLAGSILPFGMRKSKWLNSQMYVFTVVKTFGIGVILSTGFVHMFSPAQEALMNPCLPEAFQKYTAFAGLFALIAVLFTQAIQTAAINHFQKSSTQKVKPIDGEAPENSNRAASHDSIPELGALSLAKAAHDGCCATDAAVLAASHGEHRKITAYILEFGVAIHSVIIGVTLGVTSGTEFTSLLIAILFHQFFEGFALAATVLDAGFRGNFHPFILAAIYSVTTPIGVAIGIGVHAIYKENALETLLIQGIMDAISAGILIYDAMVNLMTVEITHSSRYAALSLNQKIGIMLSLWAGAGIMAVIGLWA